MKKLELRQIIKEEIKKALNENVYDKMGKIVKNLSPENFSKFLKVIGEYDEWVNTPSNDIDPINNISDRMEVFSTYTEPEIQRWAEIWKKHTNS